MTAPLVAVVVEVAVEVVVEAVQQQRVTMSVLKVGKVMARAAATAAAVERMMNIMKWCWMYLEE